jgi:hypothetical protein
LEYLFNIDICHASGAYPSYIVGIQTSFAGATIFIALNEHPFLNLIFLIARKPQIFYIGPSQFILFEDVDDMDVCRYHVKLGKYKMLVMFIGIDSGFPYGHCSNVDFVYFIWLNNDMSGFRRHALTFLPVSTNVNERLLCLRHYRIPSIGWTFVSGCPVSGPFSRDTPLSQRMFSTCCGLRL